jgi:hypothetical protein
MELHAVPVLALKLPLVKLLALLRHYSISSMNHCSQLRNMLLLVGPHRLNIVSR